MKIRPQAMNEEDAVESPAVMLPDLQAFRQTALQAVDTATAKILAKGRDTAGSRWHCSTVIVRYKSILNIVVLFRDVHC